MTRPAFILQYLQSQAVRKVAGAWSTSRTIALTNTRVANVSRKPSYSMALQNASIFSTVNWRKKGRTPMMATT